jgi:hypothetical protein
MLAGYERTFNQADFERRLRHYFSDSAPCVIRYRINLDTVDVMDAERKGSSVTVKLDAGASEEENVRIVIQEAEKALYPCLAEVAEEPEPVEAETVVRQVSKGVPLVDAMASSSRKRVVRKEYRIVRIGLNNNTVVLKQGSARIVYHLLYIPVLKFLEFLSNGKYTPESGYDYLSRNSVVKESETGDPYE